MNFQRKCKLHLKVDRARFHSMKISFLSLVLAGWHVLAATDGQIRGELVGVINRYRRVYLGRVDLRCGSISRRRAADDRTSQSSLEVLLDLDVESDYASDALFHSVL